MEGPEGEEELWSPREQKHAHSLETSRFQTVQPQYPSRFHTAASNISLADFQCPSCANILNRPIQLTLCGKMICMDGFVAHMKGGSGVCPGCSSDHEHGIDNVQSPPEVVVKLIGGLYIRCEGPACQQYVQLQTCWSSCIRLSTASSSSTWPNSWTTTFTKSTHSNHRNWEKGCHQFGEAYASWVTEENIVELVTGGQV